MPTTATPAAAPLVFPCPVVIDTREQVDAAYAFESITADAKDGRRPYHVPTVRRFLPSGDYSLEGYETRVAVERKSAPDLFQTLGRGRARFVRELDRLALYDFSAVVVEAEWSDILLNPPPHSRLSPKSVYRTVIAWEQRYRTRWWFLPGRAVAERTVFRILERYWKERQRGACAAAAKAGNSL